jgi:hypothetical protein
MSAFESFDPPGLIQVGGVAERGVDTMLVIVPGCNSYGSSLLRRCASCWLSSITP